MFKKQIQKHNFLTGGPVIQYEMDFGTTTINGSAGTNFVWGDSTLTLANNLTYSIDITQLVTEERVRQMISEYMDQLRGEQL